MHNTIINPVTNENYSIFSQEGKQLLKSYVNKFYGGGEEFSPMKQKKKIEIEIKEIEKEIAEILHQTKLLREEIKTYYNIDGEPKKTPDGVPFDQEKYDRYMYEIYELLKRREKLETKKKKLEQSQIILTKYIDKFKK